MSLCRKCGGKLQGDVCDRHGSQNRAPVKLLLQVAVHPAPVAKHDPYSADTDRRVWAMIGKVCTGCTQSCGDLEHCPMLRAKWFGDWSGENLQVEQQPAKPLIPVIAPPVKPRYVEAQLSLF